MPNQLKNTIPENVQNAVNQPVGDDAAMFYYAIKSMMPEYGNQMMENHSGKGQIYQDGIVEEVIDQLSAPWVITVEYRVDVYSDQVDQKSMVEDFKKVQKEAEKEFWKQVKPGDEQIVEYAGAAGFNPARRAVNGWPVFKLNQRLNLNAWQKESLAYINLDIGEKGRKQMAYCDAYFPLPRMIINADKAIQTHVDYFEEVEKGTMTADKESSYRQRLLEQEVAIWHNLERVANITDPQEARRIKELTGIGNDADNFNPHAARGVKSLYADTQARIVGLKTGWPIEDLNALSSFKYSMNAIYNRAYYSTSSTSPQILDRPKFAKGEQEYLTRMQQLWAKIESTPVKSNETRKALLTEMRAMVQEGLDKKFIDTSKLESGGEPFCFTLYDIERKLERQLTPAELEVMEHREPYDTAAYELAVQTETDQERIRRERYEQEQRNLEELRENTEQLRNDRQKAQEQRSQEETRRREELERQAIAGREEAPNPNYYEDVRDVQRRRRERELTAEERDERRLNRRESSNNWFYELTASKREEANQATPINRRGRPTSDENDILRYYMAQDDLTYDEALNLKLLPPEERRQLAEDYYDDLIAHPIVGVPEPEAVKNARYFGELDAKAARYLAEEPLPAFDLKDPDQLARFETTLLGNLGTFTMDFTQNDACFRNVENPSSAVRSAYVSGFGTREEYAAAVGRVSICNTLSEYVRLINNTTTTPLEKAMALHFLQRDYAELSGKPLSELPPDQWIKIRAHASAIWFLKGTDHVPEEGAPSKEAIENFLAGGEDPFSEQYLKKLEPAIMENLDRQITEPNRKALNMLVGGGFDMARIYNLSYIRQAGEQQPLTYELLTIMSPELKEKTHRIFDQTLGNLIPLNGNQAALCAAKGESVFDRFRIGGRKVSELMEEAYGKERLELMTSADREIAAEAYLMTAYADPRLTVTFVPVHYGPDQSILEGEAVSVPRPAPQRVEENPVQPPNDALLFENAVSQAAEQAEKLDSIVPGAYPVYGKNHLPGKLAAPEAQSLEGARAAKQAFLLEYAQTSRELAGKVAEERPELAGYLRLQANIATRSLAEPVPRDSLPYAALMGLVDQIHLPVPDAVDEKQPGPVFRLIADRPAGLNPFPVLEAAQSAERLMEMGREHAANLKRTGADARPEEDIRVRQEMLREITTLEGHLDEMARVAGLGRRGAQLTEAFDDPRAVNLFVNGTPGLAVMRAELQGRRRAIINGWPAEDIDMIAGFYAKREAVRQAIRLLPEGSGNRLAYERAEEVLTEICTQIDEKRITNAQERLDLLNQIDAYGPALYNDLVTRAGAPEAGQSQALRNAVTQAKNAQISPAAFRTNEQSTDLANTARELREEALREAQTRENARRERVRQQRREAREQRERLRERGVNAEAQERERREHRREENRRRQENRAIGEEPIQDDQADAAIGEALMGGLFDEAPQQKIPGGAVEDWLDAAQMNEYNDELIDQVIGAGVDEEELRDLEANPVLGNQLDEGVEDIYAGTDFDGQTFDQLFYTPEQRQISSFYPDDEYIRMLSEDENFFGNIFDEVKGQEAGYELHGNRGAKGYFEWKDIKERLNIVKQGSARDLKLKTDRLGSLTNVFYAYLMAKHQIPFDEAYRYNEGDMVTRRKEASAFLDELEAYPLSKNMSQSAREESAAYYGWMHKEALDHFAGGEFQEMDLSDLDALNRLFYGPSMTQAFGRFALDFSQDTEPLYLSDDPAVRASYYEAFGGREAHNRAMEKLSLAQTAASLAQTAAEPVNPSKPLRNRAFAKYQLELLNAQMKGKKYGDAPAGLSDHLAFINSQLASVPLPAEGAPTDQQLEDYLNGKTASPFTEAYLAAAGQQLNADIADNLRETVRGSVAKVLAGNLPNAATVYSLPYIPMGPEAARPQPDYLTISDGDLHDTHVVFTGVFGKTLFGESTMQLRLGTLKGETLADRFRINGRKVSEMPQMADVKTVRTPEEYQRILEAEILQAMADPGKTLTYTPLMYDAAGNIAEAEPVTIAKPAPVAFRQGDFTQEPAVLANDVTREIVKYTMGLYSFPLSLTVTKGLRPGDDRLDSDVQNRVISMNPVYYTPGEEDEGEMEAFSGKVLPFNHRNGVIASYRLFHGMMADGTLSEEGRKNYRDLKEHMNKEYDALQEIAAEYDAKSPMLAEMMRYTADTTTPVERGILWADLKNNYSYQIMSGAQGGLHLAPANSKVPVDQVEAMRVYTGYPYGEPKFTLPQAISAVRRMAITEGVHSRSLAAGTLSRAQDRLNRRMAIAELEEARKQLQQINKLYLSAYDENGNIDVTRPGAAHVARMDQFLEESVYNASSYYPRGTREAHADLDIKHQLISHGWPLEDVNLLAKLQMRRYQLRYALNNQSELSIKTPEEIVDMRRGLKLLDEVCRSYEERDITNAQDRQQILTQLESYGNLLFNDVVLGGDGIAHDFRERLQAAKARQLQPHEFLSAEELREFKEKDAIYQAQKDAPDIVPTMNGPQTDEERAFLNAEQLSYLMAVQGRMEADQAAYQRDPALTEAFRQVNLFANRTNAFYRNHGLLNPENAEARRGAFEDLLGASTDLVDALDEAEDKLTQSGERTELRPEEERLLNDIRQAKRSIGEMRRRYTAQMDYEAQRRDDMMAEETRRAEERAAREREMETLSFEGTGLSEGAEREEAERYMVDLDYAMSTLSEEEQRDLMERLEILTPPIPGTERFDFATGQELPPRRRPLPQRIRLAYDEEGNLRPAILLMTPEELALRRQQEIDQGLEPVDVRLARDEEQARLEAIRESRRINRERRQAEEAAGTSPYDEGAADLFASADLDARYRGGEAERERQQAIREQFIRDREHEAEGERRKARAQETGDERYSWSFAHILDDAHEKMQTADAAQKEAQKDPIAAARKAAEEAARKEPAAGERAAAEDLKDAVRNVETTTREASKYHRIYTNMERAVMASLDADALDQVLERVRPDWYHKTYLPQLESMLSAASPAERYRVGTRSALGRNIIQALPDKERHDILGAIANELPLALREQLREQLLSLDAPMERDYEDQVYRPLHNRVDELKRNAETVVDAEGNPLAPEVRKAYEEALAYADTTLDEITQETYEHATSLSTDLEIARRTIRREQTREDLEGKDPEYLILENQIMKTDERIVSEGVLPVQEQTLDQILHPANTYSPEYLQHLGHMLTRMEQMGMDPAREGEQGEKLYAYQDVAQARQAFADAVRSGDYQRIIETKRAYEEKRNNIKELMDYAKEHFSQTSAPGNVDTARNKAVPWEYSREAITNSQVNGVFQLYSILKRTGISVQQFTADPYAARRRIGEKLDEERSYGKLMTGKTMGTFLGTLMAESKMEASNRTTQAGMDDMIIGRATDALVECNPDLTVQGQNRHTDWILNNHRSIVTKVRESNRNPFTLKETQRAGEVQQLLSLVLPEDLAANSERMLCGVCYDAEGRKLPAITAQQYIASKAEFDYTRIRERSADIIRDALSVENTTFDAAAFLEERQKALSMLLTARAADAGKPGFDTLEYELTHMDEVYDQLRASNRKGMPDLSPEQRQRFKEIGRQYEAARKQIQNGFTRAQKNEIARRRRNAGNVVNASRMAIIRHEVRRNEEEDRERAGREMRARRNAALQMQEANRLRAETRLREEQELRDEARAAAEAATRESERRIARHATLPLTERFLLRLGDYATASAEAEAVKGAEGADAPARNYRAGLNLMNEKNRATRILRSAIAEVLADPNIDPVMLPQARVQELLTEELGGQRAAVIAGKLPRGLRQLDDLSDLTQEERNLVVGAVMGAVSDTARERILSEDDAHVYYGGMELKGSPYDEGRDLGERARIREQFEKQLQPVSPLNREIRELKAEIYNDWKKFTNGTGTKKQRAELAAALDYAEQMLRQVDPKVKDLVNEGRALQEAYYDQKAKRSIADQLNRPENLHLKELREDPQHTGGLLTVPRADRTTEIRNLKSEKMVFRPGYIKNVANMLRTMQDMQLLSAERGGEEGNKVYAFHKLIEAQNRLKDAIRAKDREAILDATEELKAVRRDMDELMRTAEQNFHPGEYMDNLDLVRNENIPWDYAKNAVASSQVNSVFLFGSALMDCGISVDEFEADPGAAIQRMERTIQERYSSVDGFAKGRSLGALAADAATGYLEGEINYPCAAANGRFMRSVGGLILADPGVSEEQRERNRFLLNQIHGQNSSNQLVRQHQSLVTLRNGMDSAKATKQERDALRALMVVEEQDIHPDRMFTIPPIAADGTRLEDFSLTAYLANKSGYDYQAQTTRLEGMLRDASKEVAQLKEKLAESRKTIRGDAAIRSIKPNAFRPYELLKARQEALTELLTLRVHEKGQPGYQTLEQELHELSERYERLRKAEPGLNLPELTKAQKNELKAGAKAYDDLMKNRAKLMNAEEKRINSAEAANDKAFNERLDMMFEELNAAIDKYNRYKGKLVSEQKYKELNDAIDNRVAMIGVIKRERARQLIDDYMAGKLPEQYTVTKLKELTAVVDGNRISNAETIPVFGKKQTAPGRENLRLRERERFLSLNLLENKGYRTHKGHTTLPDSMLQLVQDLKVPMAQKEIEQPKPIAEGREAQIDALLEDDEPMLAGQGEEPVIPQGQQRGPADPKQEEPVNLQGNGQPQVPVPPEVVPQAGQHEVQQPQAGQPPVQPGVHDKTFEDLEKKILGDKPGPEVHKRSGSVRLPQGRNAENGPQAGENEQQRGARMGG